MLSLFTKTMNLIYNKIINRVIVNKETNNILQHSQQMFVNDSSSSSGSDTDHEPEHEPEPAPAPEMLHKKLFNTDIPNNILTTDYELQELIKITTNSNINIDNVVLHKRFESKLAKHEDAVFKIKMRLLYVIIANNLYGSVFEEKKLYKPANKTHYPTGVFRYNDYIIRIDDSPFCFFDEEQVITALYKSSTIIDDAYKNIIIPYFTYINMKKNANGNICDCDHDPCGCAYVGDNSSYCDEDAAYDDDLISGKNEKEPPNYSRIFYNKLRHNTISFSIQPYVKDTESLYTWAKDNIKDNVNINFAKIKFDFFTDLFSKCALLLQKLHSIGIVHGDIKPDNILIKEDADFRINDISKFRLFSVYLIDFGLAGKDSIGIGTGGTIPYCHPEFRNIHDTKRTDKYNWAVIKKKHDVWSLGMTFITLYINNTFYSYYYKYPSYFFNSNGYVSNLVLDSIANPQLRRLFIDILSYDSISIDNVCEQIRVLQSTVK